ncbi:glycosyltransferase [Alicyclobacillus suci]|uniref:glycosyltransferase n=1 Tax=Alicyclobacillus suci TaxID=2816080 RepID=UPI001A8D27C8|nr:glycosyltransferase [Alicyclobacillus suci]
MRDKGLVSVIIPCYNQAQYLHECIESVKLSTYPHIEVVIVDDGSSAPGTDEVLNDLQYTRVKGNFIRVHRQKNMGLSAARNIAIALSKGQYILPLDADDMIDPTFIEKCVWVLTKYSDISIVYPSVRHFGIRNDCWDSRPYDFRLLLRENFIIATSMFRYEVWESIGGYDTDLPAYEDWDFWIRAGAAGYLGYWLPEYLFLYRKKDNSLLTSANLMRRKLYRAIKRKNRYIYRTNSLRLRNILRSERDRPSSKHSLFSESIRWRMFVLYVRIANKFPASLKSRVKHYVKPLIMKVFKYPETGFVQVLTLDDNPADFYLRDKHRYLPNTEYLAISEEGKSHTGVNLLLIVPWLVTGGADKVNLDLVENLKCQSTHIMTTLPTEHEWEGQFRQHTPHITHLGNWFTSLDSMTDYVLDYIARHKIDVVLISNSQLGYQLSEPLKRVYSDLKIVDLLHMEEPHEPFDYFRYSARYKSNLDHRIVITNALKKSLVSLYGESEARVSVIPNGVKVSRSYRDTGYIEKLHRKRIHIGFVGRMVKQKQPMDFIHMASLLSQMSNVVEFSMVGDGELLSEVAKAVESSGLNIQILGRKERGIDHIRDAVDILVAPSLREGLPIVGLEALSVGVPVVAYDVPGWRDLIIDGMNGYLVPMGDIKGLASQVKSILEDNELREQLSINAYTLVSEKFSIQRMSDSYLNLFLRLKNGTSRCFNSPT